MTMTTHRYTVSLDDPTTARATGHAHGRRPLDVARRVLDCDPSGQFDRGPVYVQTVLGTDLRRYREYAVCYASGTLSTLRVWVSR
jgi:hypothetical protein